MSILVQRPGILTTVQDLGRYGYQRFGINPGGVMDVAASRLLNILLGNTENEAVLEMHFPAPQVVFEKETMIAIGGADFEPLMDGTPIPCWGAVRAAKGAVLAFAGKKLGNRAYLAVQSGLDIETWLGSMSTNLTAKIGGFSGRRLEAGDRIMFRDAKRIAGSNARLSPWLVPSYSAAPTLKILPGAEFDELTVGGRETFLKGEFSISSRSDRMGFRLNGQPVELSDRRDMVSSPVSFGTIQSLPDDQLIILMADHQTTGGYPRLAHVISFDLPLVAQLGPGDEVSFQLISQDKAETLEMDFVRHLKFLQVGSRFETA
jgi:antagonist of KipI